MKRHLTGAIAAAAGAAAFAMLTQPVAAAQSPTPSTTSTQTAGTSADQRVTITGCVEREADYRQSAGAGRAGAAGTGVGAGNEFVLTNAMMSPASTGAPAATSGAGAPSATGTAGTAGKAYELTGTKEGDAAAFIGRKVEISGIVKAATTAPGGPTADLPGSRDLKLEELEVSSVRAAIGSCSPATTAP
ncbi:MAG TPA: hypothetical protein VL173_00055 [Vicinamibacterales bacterium]|jgi:hypothetical protein|nr:hypothetical protein [Vicinamibacterales bacterium]